MQKVYFNYCHLVIILLPVFFFSCSSTGTITKPQFYNDLVYQQLWTADWSPDNKLEGTLLATVSDVLRIWTNTGVLLYQGKPDTSNYLWGIDWNGRDEKIVTTSRHKTVALWNSRAKLLRRIDIGK